MEEMKQVKQEYDDWVALLKGTNNEDLLNDPYAVWIEAWHVATMLLKKKIPTELPAGKNH
jgi:hypothetical protein